MTARSSPSTAPPPHAAAGRAVAAEEDGGEHGDAEEHGDDAAEQNALHVFKPQRETASPSEDFVAAEISSDTAALLGCGLKVTAPHREAPDPAQGRQQMNDADEHRRVTRRRWLAFG